MVPNAPLTWIFKREAGGEMCKTGRWPMEKKMLKGCRKALAGAIFEWMAADIVDWMPLNLKTRQTRSDREKVGATKFKVGEATAPPTV